MSKRKSKKPKFPAKVFSDAVTTGKAQDEDLFWMQSKFPTAREGDYVAVYELTDVYRVTDVNVEVADNG